MSSPHSHADSEPGATPDPDSADPSRRSMLRAAPLALMGAGLAGGYGTLAATAGRYLFPPEAGAARWLFATDIGALKRGESLSFRAPSGERITIARRGDGATASDFIALSSTCPHLGCQVRWEQQHTRFFCPCHNGTFDAEGTATGGPPGDAGQTLPRYELRAEGGLLYIRVPDSGLEVAALERVDTPGIAGPGHDPCLEGCVRPREVV